MSDSNVLDSSVIQQIMQTISDGLEERWNARMEQVFERLTQSVLQIVRDNLNQVTRQNRPREADSDVHAQQLPVKLPIKEKEQAEELNRLLEPEYGTNGPIRTCEGKVLENLYVSIYYETLFSSATKLFI